MLIKNDNSSLNFGWSGKTHKAITQAAVNKINKVASRSECKNVFNTQLLTDASILPDKEPHLPCSHSADIDNHTSDDALSMFKQWDKKIKDSIANKSSESLNDYIGRALHYLQDMQNPLHVNSKKLQTSKKAMMHERFESNAEQIQHEAIQYAKGLQTSTANQFEDFLSLKMRETKNASDYIDNNMIKPKNEARLEKNGLINTYLVTYEYLNELAQLIKQQGR